MAEPSTVVLPSLRQLNSYDALIALAVDGLGFTFADEPRSTAAWPAALRNAVHDVRVAARHGEFLVTYARIADVAQPRALSVQRQVAAQILKAEPHTLLVFADEAHRLWHFVHVRYDPVAERRRQLRRFVVDLRDPRRADRLRTTAERLARLAIPPAAHLTAPQVQERCDEAFRVSEISNRFLRDFRRVIEGLTASLQAANGALLASDRDALQQAQLLMDRLVFLYFIQRKGWLNGEDDYLYTRFQRSYQAGRDDDTFYRQRLLPLFHALSHRDWERPRLDSGAYEALPFLNGGLFDLPLDYGTADPPLDERIRVPNQTLHAVFADFLEKYNFTVTEDSPLDVEVAVNPEVIGTIFETFVLTAENEPDTNAPDRRKATGSYYTPRVVVHFICRAVLRRYLVERTGIDEQVVKQLIEFDPAEQLDETGFGQLAALVTAEQAADLRRWALALRACDPAVGSGAFPVGLLQEMVKLVRLLDLRTGGAAAIAQRNYAYRLKKEIIENCLYGVDIQEQAVRICELRLWLSLIVDYQWDDAVSNLGQRIAGVEPLPNLTFKVRVGDALLDRLFGKDWEVTAQRHDVLTAQIRALKRAYYGSRSPEGKRDLERQVLELELEQLEHRLNDQRLSIGATIPLSPDMLTPAQRRQFEAARAKLADVDAVLDRLAAARRDMAVHPATSESGRRFDAARQRLAVSFVWALDFAEVFDPEGLPGDDRAPGFDIIVGNPPFVTARNPDRRERYRARWPTSTFQKYQLVAPFIELSLTKLLRGEGQIGLILSNAFATRDFGKPIVEQVFRGMELLNVIDCSGLMFPGHGTPTSIVLGQALEAGAEPVIPTLLCGTRPGMGQLREEPEETALWGEVERSWEDSRSVGDHVVVAQWSITEARTHPWSFDAGGSSAKRLLERGTETLRTLLSDNVGVATMTNSDEVFDNEGGHWRRNGVESAFLTYFVEGPENRDWSIPVDRVLLSPYDQSNTLCTEARLPGGAQSYMKRLRSHLQGRHSFASKTFEQLGRPWYEFERWNSTKYNAIYRLVQPFIATHFHLAPPILEWGLNRHSQVVPMGRATDVQPTLALLNSSSALFWLKQVCFCKRYSENPETDDYYEFAGGKVEQLPVPDRLLQDGPLRRRAAAFAGRCAALGAEVPGLHPRKLFERPGEAYTDWYRGIRGYQEPHPYLQQGWTTAAELQAAWHTAVDDMHALRRQMVALQEEQDWLLYAAYGLLPEDDPAVNVAGPDAPMPIDQLDRPYRLIQHQREVPCDWPAPQQALWHARLAAIEANPHVGQIEQPAYKRRWVEPFDDGDFLDAYEWWLKEKAEWLLEREWGGGPVALEAWAARLREDRSVVAAYEAALAIDRTQGKPRYNPKHGFVEHLRRLVEEETVPDDRASFKPKHVKLRGIDPRRHLLNGVPRERFRSLSARPGWYVWAGQDIWGGVKGDAWDD